MPYNAKSSNQYYSFTIGKIHFLGINYEFYQSEDQSQQEYIKNWVINDLTTANNSKFHIPWIVVYTHYPIYCSYNGGNMTLNNNCSNFYPEYKEWDELWFNFNVDIVLQGHINYWERYIK
jgi:hypothetical protein